MKGRDAIAIAAFAAIALLSGCDADHVSAPDDTGSRVVTSSCQASCVIFDTPPPALDREVDPDSLLAPFTIATADIVGTRGATVALRIEMTAAFAASVDTGAAAYVTIGENTQVFSMPDLMRGVVVHTFTGTDSIRISYRIRRALVENAADTPGAGFVIRQSVRGAARVATVMAPFTRRRVGKMGQGALGPSLSEVDPESCSVLGAGTYCETLVGMLPFWRSSPVFPDAFENTPYQSGPSDTLLVTFSPAIRSFTVTALDPDYPGNRAVVMNPTGDVVAQLDFTSDGVPGVYTESTVGYLGTVGSIRLIPGSTGKGQQIARDYVAYRMTIIGSPRLIIDCTPTPVERGDNVACEVRLADPIPGLLVERRARGWSPLFSDPTLFADSSSQPIAAGDYALWAGPMAVSTWIGFGVQTAGQGGSLFTTVDSVEVLVQPRVWTPPAQHTVALQEQYDSTGLTSPAIVDVKGGQIFEPFGLGAYDLRRMSSWAWLDEKRPNHGWHYKYHSSQIDPNSGINYHPWLQPGSAFQLLQTGGKKPGTSTPYCQAIHVDSLRWNVEAHERRHYAMAVLFYQTHDVNAMDERAVFFFAGNKNSSADQSTAALMATAADNLAFLKTYLKWQDDSVHNGNYPIWNGSCLFRIP